MGSIDLKSHEIIKGKWKGTPYEVIKKIGAGGLGEVYLVKNLNDTEYYALKISKDNISINREYDLIKELVKIDIVINAFEIDDLQIGTQTYYYICLEYIKGTNLQNYLKKKVISLEVILGSMLVIVHGLSKIHSQGYILGDLKLDNIMLDRKTKELRIIDLGGAVKKGETINEYTPSYDRAKWNCGDRTSTESYDLFIVTIIIIRLITRKELNPRLQNINEVIEFINIKVLSDELKGFLINGLLKEQKTNFFAKELRKIYNREKLNNRRKRINSFEKKINIVFFSSVLLFVTTSLYILLNL